MKHADSIVISVAVANFNKPIEVDLISFLKGEIPDLSIYKLVPTPGTIYAAAFDWKFIGKLSSILSIASFLWMAYIELIKPLKSPDSDSGIVIRIENMNTTNYFWIGKEIDSQNELLDSISSLIQKNKIDRKKTIEEINELINSKNWKKIK